MELKIKNRKTRNDYTHIKVRAYQRNKITKLAKQKGVYVNDLNRIIIDLGLEQIARIQFPMPVQAPVQTEQTEAQS